MSTKPSNPRESQWLKLARKALDSWAPHNADSVAVALEEAYRGGIVFAAKFLDTEGEPELAKKLREAARKT